MGISTFILFKSGESIPANDLISSITNICEVESLFFDTEEKKYMNDGTLKYCQVYISDIPFEESYSRQLCFSVYDEPYDYQTVDFKWEKTPNKYFKAMISDDFYENEDLLLRFIYSLISIYPNAKVWIEEDWFYTLEDLERIVKNPYNSEWCYKKPS